MKTILITTSSFTAEGFPSEYKVVKNPHKRKLTEIEAFELFIKYQPVGVIAGVEPITEKVMRASKNLKVISRCGIGLDSVDIEAAKKIGITVVNTPDAPTEAVAELTIGMILALFRNISLQDRQIRDGKWKGPKGILLQGKTAGIIGCGRIGSRVAQILKVFGCNILGYDPRLRTHEDIELVEKSFLLKNADFVTLHVPLSESTKNIISSSELSIMKESAFIINCSRGGLVDERELYKCLLKGEIAGAALDCFESEPYIGKLKELENVLLSPHMGSSTFETRIIMENKAVDNLIQELKH